MDNDRIVEIGARALDRLALSGQGWSKAAIDRAVTSLVQPSKHGIAHAKCILSALRSAGLVLEQGWQPISTAPKDGTPILLAQGQSIVALGAWLGDGWKFWGGDYDNAVYAEDDDHVVRLNSWIAGHGPTHWRSLPAPPAAKADPQ